MDGLYGVYIRSSDLKGLSDFYTKILGLKLRDGSDEAVCLHLKNEQWLWIMKQDEAKPLESGKASRSAFGLKVKDVDAMHKQLKTRKAPGLTAPKDRGSVIAFSVVDPDGNEIFIMQDKQQVNLGNDKGEKGEKRGISAEKPGS